MIGRILYAAVLAGVVAGLVVTVVQLIKVTPTIHFAEAYEEGTLTTKDHSDRAVALAAYAKLGEASEAEAAAEAAPGHAEDGHSHDDDGWAPRNDQERFFYTGMYNILAGFGFGLLIVAGMTLRGHSVDLKTGLIWGVCGFLVTTGLPSLGLSPELPGTIAAELGERQQWWMFTVIASICGIAAIAFGSHMAVKAGGVVLLVLPHLVGAPLPDEPFSNAPHWLHTEFNIAVILTTIVFWLVLGGVIGWLMRDDPAAA